MEDDRCIGSNYGDWASLNRADFDVPFPVSRSVIPAQTGMTEFELGDF
jgi:hypothetical protein